MTIESIVDDSVFNYYLNYGTGNVQYLGNWCNFLPKNLNTQLISYNWDKVVLRNFEEVIKHVDSDSEKILYNVGFFNNFESTDHIRWKIIKNTDLDVSWEELHKKISTYLSVYEIWISQIPSGCCIPQHLDTIDSFMRRFRIDKFDIEKIKRIVILPQDLKPWHHLWYGNKIIFPAEKGDTFSFNFWEPHGGSNLGPEPKYTIQIIGV